MSFYGKLLDKIFYPEQLLFEAQGLYSKIKVVKRGDWLSLYTGEKYLQTYINNRFEPKGNIFDWYLAGPWFSGNFDGNLESVLILGLGGGSQVKYFNKFYKVKSITGVEIDPQIIDIGKKYFDLNDENLKTVNGDAAEYLDKDEARYDLIMLDTFKKNVFEKNCESESYFQKAKNHLTPQGVLLVNKVCGDPDNNEIENELKKAFKKVYALQFKFNIFYIATDSDNAPNSAGEAKKLLLKASKSNRELKFFAKDPKNPLFIYIN